MFEPLPTTIRDERERQQLSQLALANLSGVSRTTIVGLESGEDNVSLGLLMKVATALGLTELQIGDLWIGPASPDLRVLLMAREAIAAAQKVISQSAASQQELDALAEAVSEMLHRESEPPHVPDVGIDEAAERLVSGPDGPTARALRDLADAGATVRHPSVRSKAAAKPARKRGR